MKESRIVFAAVVLALCFAPHAFAQNQPPAGTNSSQAASTGNAPLDKKRLLKLLLVGDATPQQLIQMVNQQGVSFQATPSDERELHEGGATDDLIVAVRANFRGAAQSSTASA